MRNTIKNPVDPTQTRDNLNTTRGLECGTRTSAESAIRKVDVPVFFQQPLLMIFE